MSSNKLGEMTPEQRLSLLEKARVARLKKQEEGKNLRQDWLDASLWAHLRSVVGLRSPPAYIPCSELKYIRRTLKALGKDTEWYYDNFSKPLGKFAEDNPDAPAYVLQGLMLEAAYPELVNNRKSEGSSDDN